MLSLYLALVPAVCAATSQVLSTESPVEHDQRTASCDTSLVVSGGVDCERRRLNVYDKKPQNCAKDNRTAHLTARCDKTVAYVTNNKRLTRRFVLLKPTADRHKALHRLFATAELLVFVIVCSLQKNRNAFRSLRTI